MTWISYSPSLPAGWGEELERKAVDVDRRIFRHRGSILIIYVAGFVSFVLYILFHILSHWCTKHLLAGFIFISCNGGFFIFNGGRSIELLHDLCIFVCPEEILLFFWEQTQQQRRKELICRRLLVSSDRLKFNSDRLKFVSDGLKFISDGLKFVSNGLKFDSNGLKFKSENVGLVFNSSGTYVY